MVDGKRVFDVRGRWFNLSGIVVLIFVFWIKFGTKMPSVYSLRSTVSDLPPLGGCDGLIDGRRPRSNERSYVWGGYTAGTLLAGSWAKGKQETLRLLRRQRSTVN